MIDVCPEFTPSLTRKRGNCDRCGRTRETHSVPSGRKEPAAPPASTLNPEKDTAQPKESD
jgi:hypothetical protein